MIMRERYRELVSCKISHLRKIELVRSDVLPYQSFNTRTTDSPTLVAKKL